MKKVLLVLALLCILLLGAKSQDVVHLTIKNKAPLKVAVKLVELEQKRAYYFQIDAASSVKIQEEIFPIERGDYTMNVYYLEIYDPVYGYSCDEPGSSTLAAHRDIRVTVNDCEKSAPNRGEETLVKYGRWKVIY